MAEHVSRVDITRDGATRTLIDLTSDTITADALLATFTAHDASGSPITGAMQDGDPLAYGTSTSNRVGAARADSAIIVDYTGTTTGRALAGLAVLGE